MLTQNVVFNLPRRRCRRPVIVNLDGAGRRLGHPGGGGGGRGLQRAQRVSLGHGHPHGARAGHLLNGDGEVPPLFCIGRFNLIWLFVSIIIMNLI